MSDYIDLILSNKLYIITIACILGVMFIFVLKKMTKLLVYTFIALIVLMAYIFYKNESVTSTAEPLQKAVEKAKTIVK